MHIDPSVIVRTARHAGLMCGYRMQASVYKRREKYGTLHSNTVSLPIDFFILILSFRVLLIINVKKGRGAFYKTHKADG